VFGAGTASNATQRDARTVATAQAATDHCTHLVLALPKVFVALRNLAASCGFSCGARCGKGVNGTECALARSRVINKLQCFQRLADGLEWFLSPVRLPVSPPGRVEKTATYCITPRSACSPVEEFVGSAGRSKNS